MHNFKFGNRSIKQFFFIVLIPLIVVPFAIVMFLSHQVLTDISERIKVDGVILQTKLHALLQEEFNRITLTTSLLVKSDELVNFVKKTPEEARLFTESHLIGRMVELLPLTYRESSRWIILDKNKNILIDYFRPEHHQIKQFLLPEFEGFYFDANHQRIIYRKKLYFDDEINAPQHGDSNGDILLILALEDFVPLPVRGQIDWQAYQGMFDQKQIKINSFGRESSLNFNEVVTVALCFVVLFTTVLGFYFFNRVIVTPLTQLAEWVRSAHGQPDGLLVEKNEIKRLKLAIGFYHDSERLITKQLLEEP
jgi:hypothetical protein